MKAFRLAADVLRTACGKDMAPFTTAIIVSAGQSTRMGGTVSKQFLSVDGLPVLARTLLAFEACGKIDEIVVVTRPESIETVEELQAAHRISKLTRIVKGGETRQDSVKNGFEAISPKARFVAIHDGARCLITPEMIDKVLHAAYVHKAASAATGVSDTVKIADARGFVTNTVNRDTVYLAQTPQVFHTALYKAALENAKGDAVTDDNQLVERLGHPIKLVDCGADNIKITRPDDIGRAEAILKKRGGNA